MATPTPILQTVGSLQDNVGAAKDKWFARFKSRMTQKRLSEVCREQIEKTTLHITSSKVGAKGILELAQKIYWVANPSTSEKPDKDDLKFFAFIYVPSRVLNFLTRTKADESWREYLEKLIPMPYREFPHLAVACGITKGQNEKFIQGVLNDLKTNENAKSVTLVTSDPDNRDKVWINKYDFAWDGESVLVGWKDPKTKLTPNYEYFLWKDLTAKKESGSVSTPGSDETEISVRLTSFYDGTTIQLLKFGKNALISGVIAQAKKTLTKNHQPCRSCAYHIYSKNTTGDHENKLSPRVSLKDLDKSILNDLKLKYQIPRYT